MGETGVGEGRLRCLVAEPDESCLMDVDVFALDSQNCRGASLAAQNVRRGRQDVCE